MKKFNLIYTISLLTLLAITSCEDYWTGQKEVITELTISNGNVVGCPGDSIKFWALDQNGDTTSNVYWHSTCEDYYQDYYGYWTPYSYLDATGFMILPQSGDACHVIAKAVADNVTSDPILVKTVVSDSCND
mgnify:CR=1 FL=1